MTSAPSWDNAHDRAVREGKPTYTDPRTGYEVFTSAALAARGSCCGSGCRHCPYGHFAVQGSRPRRAAGLPSFRVRAQRSASPPVDVLFWSGGKDSFLAWLALEPSGRSVVLFTTYDEERDLVAHQEVSRAHIEAQARWLDADLMMVPLVPDVPYAQAVERGLDAVDRVLPVARLAFGDLHLQQIRRFREETLGPWAAARDVEIVFPLWGLPYDTLLARLRASRARVTLSATPAGLGTVGEPFDDAFVASLPTSCDPFGENGEFHTYVSPEGDPERDRPPAGVLRRRGEP